MKIREALKGIPYVAHLNASRRARQVEISYLKLLAEYRGRPCSIDDESLWEQSGIGQRGLSRPPRVLFCGTDQLQDFGGFVQALESCVDLRLLRRPSGEYGQKVEGIAWEDNARALREALEGYSREGWTPEVVLMQSMGYRFNPTSLGELKQRYRFLVVNIGMDERLAYRVREHHGVDLGISGLNSVVDVALVTVPEAVDWYRKDGVPASYFPLASSADVYYPREDVKKSHDVGFIGRAYGRRLELARKIAASGLTFEGRGPGWEAGQLPVSKNNEFYNSCRVVLGAGNIGYSKRLMNPKLRDFEVPFTAVPYVTNYTPELAELFEEDVEMVFYRSEAELVSKLRSLISDSQAATSIGRAGWRRAMRDHQYGSRLELLFDGLLRGDFNTDFAAANGGAHRETD